jgi:PPK2 family polyphosphate:nucleotide phosphotransferase
MSNPLSISTRAPKHLDKEKIKAKTEFLKKEIGELQKILFAQAKHSLLIILQGVDASGKDGLIANVFSGLNPLGCNVYAYKVPTPEEAAHDFLWRIHKNTPPKGMIHIFNRSHYEDLLVPVIEKTAGPETLKHRVSDINHFEQLLHHNNTHVLKLYLHISKEEQKERLTDRKTNPKKYWKHKDEDWDNRRKWHAYMEAYKKIFHQCNKPQWHIIPADQNWYKEYLVADIVLKSLKKMKLEYPGLDEKPEKPD